MASPNGHLKVDPNPTKIGNRVLLVFQQPDDTDLFLDTRWVDGLKRSRMDMFLGHIAGFQYWLDSEETE